MQSGEARLGMTKCYRYFIYVRLIHIQHFCKHVDPGTIVVALLDIMNVKNLRV